MINAIAAKEKSNQKRELFDLKRVDALKKEVELRVLSSAENGNFSACVSITSNEHKEVIDKIITFIKEFGYECQLFDGDSYISIYWDK